MIHLVFLNSIATNRKMTMDERDGLLERLHKQTLGMLLNELRRKVPVSDQIEHNLAAALQNRNFLIHQFFYERVGCFLNPEGRGEMLRELKEMSDQFSIADNEVERLNHELMASIGMTVEHLRSAAMDLYGAEVAQRLYPRTTCD